MPCTALRRGRASMPAVRALATMTDAACAVGERDSPRTSITLAASCAGKTHHILLQHLPSRSCIYHAKRAGDAISALICEHRSCLRGRLRSACAACRQKVWHSLCSSQERSCKATWRSPSAGASGHLWGGLIRRPSGRNNAELTAVLSKLLLRASLAATALQSASTQCSAFFLTLGALSASLQGPGRRLFTSWEGCNGTADGCHRGKRRLSSPWYLVQQPEAPWKYMQRIWHCIPSQT